MNAIVLLISFIFPVPVSVVLPPTLPLVVVLVNMVLLSIVIALVFNMALEDIGMVARPIKLFDVLLLPIRFPPPLKSLFLFGLFRTPPIIMFVLLPLFPLIVTLCPEEEQSSNIIARSTKEDTLGRLEQLWLVP